MGVNPEIPENFIRDDIRLGEYNKEGPTLVRLSRTYELSSSLNNRKVLRNTNM